MSAASGSAQSRWNTLTFAGLPLALTLIAASLALFGSACQRGEASPETDSSTTGESAAADSSETEAAAADSDSTDAEASKSWKDKLFGGDDDDEEKEEPPVPVEMATVTTKNIPAYLTSTATLEPEKQAQVLAKIDGEVLKIHVEEGDWVREGDVLAELDGKAQGVVLEEMTARAKGLQLELERTQSLHEQQLASEKDYNNAHAEFAQAEAQRKASELNYVHTKIRAPFSGRISERQVDVGQNISIGGHLFTVVDNDPLLARIYLPEREVVRLEPAQEVKIQSDADPDLQLPGSVLRVAPVVDTRTGTVKVTCEVNGEAALLRPGSFVRVMVQTGLHENVLSIPKRSLVPEGAETYVFKAEADSVVKVSVTTGFAADDTVEIIDGLELGDQVVTVGHGALKPGTKVKDMSRTDDEKIAAVDS